MTVENQDGNTPDGGSWAAVLAAGIGCAAIGILTDLSEASKLISSALSISKQVGDLSGKTTLSIVCWLIAWALLHFRWRRRDLATPGRVAALTIVLVLVSLIGVFPPFFKLFSSD
jgi:fluoride ion exporter CrcB/FEX